MASTSHTDTPKEAPWRATFLEHVNSMDSPEFVFASLAPATSSSSPTPYVPRARFCIFRGLWAELPENKHNNAPKNERVYQSDMPTFTTDVRMQKVWELFASSPGKAEDVSQVRGSGGGGPCEAVWWNKETKIQWRVKGEAYIVGPDIEGEGEQSKESSGVRTTKSELGSRMRIVKEDGTDKWSWKTELTSHFGNVSPGMRGSFANPPPGKPVDEPFEGDLKVGEKVEDLDDATARQNFRVVVIKPEEVESVDLSDPKTSRRQLYKYDSNTSSWSQQELWP
ncbi:uncharacterized protein K489DRAFT_378488 [Dissoconium aciculare CBS 342.82]|uniref:Pyridoxamine 5'-phosphate oxidase Alr4036 family FMN-binding domain-containing protein n=1 Tax=Dissoconium aciculare CBS 342.82 TaxID=1314786 RepID=A0A6J3M7X2_9PEZI|nr:uncharacterized protein K489DRAFT_378488 [Dissoconium aciculare CBS 342.82]KAF1824095.1 hypothetical protein K489DRAFT_378488 [Dissoconium aciculare CBS 342.82]